MTQTFLRRTDVEKATGLPRSTIYAMIDKDQFPKPIKIGERSVAWLENEIQAWQRDRIDSRDKIAA